MILHLMLKNIALIKSAEIEFSKGLNVLSGETGAGKTVIISAVNFALGGKADKTMIRYGESVAEAEITFDVSNNIDAKAVLDDFDIETAGGGSEAENPLKVEISDDVIGARYYESTADGTPSIKPLNIIFCC